MAGPAGHQAPTRHPLALESTVPANVERWRPLVNWVLVLPLALWLVLLLLGAAVVGYLGWFAIVFTGGMPDSWSDYQVGVLRYQWRITAFLYGFSARYPGFSVVPGHIDPGDQAAILYCARPYRRDRLSVAVRLLLSLPQILVVAALGLATAVASGGAWLAVLLTGRWPEGLGRFATGYFRYASRVQAYQLLVTDAYPPFSFRS